MSSELWVKHDLRTRDDLKTKHLFRLCTSRGERRQEYYGCFWWLIELIDATDSKMIPYEEETFACLSEEWQKPDTWVRAFLEDLCVSKLCKLVSDPGETDGKMANDGKIFLLFPRQKRDAEKRICHKEEIAAKRREAGSKGAESRWNKQPPQKGQNGKMAKKWQSMAKCQKERIDNISISKDIDINTQPPLLSEPEKVEAPLKLYGERYLSMTEEEMAHVIGRFGRELVEQEIPFAETWIAKSESKNGKKYRQPGYNHFLFLNNTWMRGKTLERPQQSGPGKTSAFEKNLRERERLLQKVTA